MQTPAELHDFEIYLRYELNRSALTVDAYISDAAEFIRFYIQTGHDEFHPEEISVHHIRAWIGHLAGNGLSASSIRRKTQSLRALFRYLHKRKKIESDPTADIILAKIPRPLPKFVRQEEMESLLSEAPVQSSDIKEKFKSVRDALILEILYTSGLRQAELLALADTDVLFQRAQLRVMGKRSKQRIIPIAPQILSRINDYIRLREETFPHTMPHNKLFLTNKGLPLNKEALYNIVKEKLSATSSEKKSPHVLRHTFATAMLNNGAGLLEVKEFLGHASLDSTQIYTHVTFEELKRNYNQAHPRAIKNKQNGSDD